MALDPYIDPRNEPFEIPVDALSEDALDGLIEGYCTQFHGLNDLEDPVGNKAVVRKAIEKGDLAIWFDPVEGTASLHPKASMVVSSGQPRHS